MKNHWLQKTEREMVGEMLQTAYAEILTIIEDDLKLLFDFYAAGVLTADEVREEIKCVPNRLVQWAELEEI